MGYILYHIPSKRRVSWFITERGAMANRTTLNRSACDWVYDIMKDQEFREKYNTEKTFNDDCSDPSTELFWST